MTDRDGQSFVRREANSIEMLLGGLGPRLGMGLQAGKPWRDWEPAARDHAGATLFAPDGPQPRQAAAAQMADIFPALAEACMIGAASAMRYWSALAELGLRYEASLVQTVADQTTGRSVVSPADCRVYADELRAFLRRVGDVANLEARLLQRDLDASAEPSPRPPTGRRRRTTTSAAAGTRLSRECHRRHRQDERRRNRRSRIY